MGGVPQTSVDDAPVIGVAGQLASLHTLADGDVVSKTSGEASSGIPFGVAVGQGTADDEVILLAATTDKLVGIAVFGHSYAIPEQLELDGGAADLGGLTPGTTFGVLRRGRIVVIPEDGVDPTKGVFIRAVAAGAEQKGAFRGTADGTDTIAVSLHAKWVTTAGAGEPAVVEIDFLNTAVS